MAEGVRPGTNVVCCKRPSDLLSKPYWSAFWTRIDIIQFLSNVDAGGRGPGPYTRS